VFVVSQQQQQGQTCKQFTLDKTPRFLLWQQQQILNVTNARVLIYRLYSITVTVYTTVAVSPPSISPIGTESRQLSTVTAAPFTVTLVGSKQKTPSNGTCKLTLFAVDVQLFFTVTVYVTLQQTLVQYVEAVEVTSKPQSLLHKIVICLLHPQFLLRQNIISPFL
jgi:hypothetical protein